MDACPVTCVSLNKDLAAPHGIACRVTDAAMDHDPSGVHGIAHRILCVGINRDLGSVEICAQRISGDSLNGDFLIGHSCCKEALTTAVCDRAAVPCFPDLFVQFLIVPAFCIYRHHNYTTPPSFFPRFSFGIAANVAAFLSISKSMVSSGIFSRIREV